MPLKPERELLIALGVTGCIGAYKSAEILRRLQDRGFGIQPILTSAAQRFITPLTLQTLAGRTASKSLWDEPTSRQVEHIALSDEIALLLVAPATANTIAKFAHGIADDFLSTLYLSADCPVVIAPAMNAKMWKHQATRANVETLLDRGVVFVQPGEGYLACGWEGEGRLAGVADIIDATEYALREKTKLANRKIVITAGPTAEDIDPLRFVSNRSSGRMGYDLAWEAIARGAEVSLISGPSELRPPYGVHLIQIRSASEMRIAVERELANAAVVIMAAAVADYRPAITREHKIKKSGEPLTISLEPTEDILASLGSQANRPFLIGFAAESENLKENAGRKLHEKGADMIVANPIAGNFVDAMGGEDTQGVILCSNGTEIDVQPCSKRQMAGIILDEAEKRL